MDERVMSFGEHLIELRKRIFVSMISVIVAFVVIFFIFDKYLLEVMKWPIYRVLESMGRGEESQKFLQALKPAEAFLTVMKTAFGAAIVAAVPIWLYELWMFVAPGLKPRERRAIFPALFFGVFLFAIGALVAYLLMIPVMLRYLLGYTLSMGVSANWTLSGYLEFEFILMAAFGIAFELPLVITILTLVGMVTPRMLTSNRRYAILIMFIAAAVLTPGPDVLSQIMMALPLLVLYEVSIWLSKIFYKRRWRGLDELHTSEPPDGG